MSNSQKFQMKKMRSINVKYLTSFCSNLLILRKTGQKVIFTENFFSQDV